MVHSAVALPASLNEYLDTGRSPLNPNNRGFGFYVYGDLPLTIVQLLGRWAARPDTHLDAWIAGVELGTDYGVVYRLGRIVSALCDCLTLVLLYLVGARLYGRAVGLLAAALYAAAVLPIQQAHFFTVDAMANLFVVAALWLAARAAARARWSDDVLFGLALAAGLACKLSVFPIAALLAISVVLRFAAHAQVVRDEALPPEQRRRRTAQLAVRALLSLNVVVLTAVLAFRLLQPYAFVPSYGGPTVPPDAWQVASNVVAPHLNPRWLDQMAKSRLQQVGADDAPPNHQWATRTPFAFPWRNLVQYGLGWPLGLAAWLGWLWALVEGLRGRPESWRHVLPVAWIALCFGWFGAGWVLTMRYFLPLVPALCLTAAWALVRIAAPQWDASSPAAAAPPAWRRAAGGLAIALVLVPTYAWALAFTSIYTRPHTRIAASRWLYDTLPGKVTLHIEDDHGRPSMRPVGLPTSAQPEAAADAPEPPVTVVGPQAATSTRFRAAGDGVPPQRRARRRPPARRRPARAHRRHGRGDRRWRRSARRLRARARPRRRLPFRRRSAAGGRPRVRVASRQRSHRARGRHGARHRRVVGRRPAAVAAGHHSGRRRFHHLRPGDGVGGRRDQAPADGPCPRPHRLRGDVVQPLRRLAAAQPAPLADDDRLLPGAVLRGARLRARRPSSARRHGSANGRSTIRAQRKPSPSTTTRGC